MQSVPHCCERQSSRASPRQNRAIVIQTACDSRAIDSRGTSVSFHLNVKSTEATEFTTDALARIEREWSVAEVGQEFLFCFRVRVRPKTATHRQITGSSHSLNNGSFREYESDAMSLSRIGTENGSVHCPSSIFPAMTTLAMRNIVHKCSPSSPAPVQGAQNTIDTDFSSAPALPSAVTNGHSQNPSS